MKPSTLMAFLGGAAAGAIVALLFAPEKGSETRKKIKETLDEEIDKLREKVSKKVCADLEDID